MIPKMYKNVRKFSENKSLSHFPTFCSQELKKSRTFQTSYVSNEVLSNFCLNWIVNMKLYLSLEILLFFETFRNKRTHSTTLWFISNNMKGRLTKRIIEVWLHFTRNSKFFRTENIEISWKFRVISWVKILHEKNLLKAIPWGRFNDFGFHGPPTPAGQGPCGFDKGRSLIVK